ncbi:MAG: SCO family protein [Calditrichaeota bacterium]|nr:MAG: SCO family protein [Calditrichota bacterium]
MQDLEKQQKIFKRLFLLLFSLLFLSLSLAFSIFFLIKFPDYNSSKLPVYGNVPEFTLINQNGQNFSSKDLNGKIWVADFIFTNCGSSCPLMTLHMSELQKALPKTWQVRLVSITVDPERDTPEVLSQYANNYGADTNLWYFLTGDRQTIVHLAQDGFHLGVGEVTYSRTNVNKDEILHSIKFVLVDQKGQIRGYYNGTEKELVENILHDIKKLRKNAAT